MRVLGIDPGYAIVGWGVLDYAGNRFAPVDFGAVCTDAGVPFEQRLDEVYTGIREVIERTQPEVLAIEKLFYQHNQTTVIGVAEARGVILLAAAQAGIPIYQHTPKEGKTAKVNCMYADSTFLEMFQPTSILSGSMEFLYSDNKIALTEETAMSLFDSTEVLGQEIEIGNVPKTVCAILKNVEKHSNLYFAAWAMSSQFQKIKSEWGVHRFQTYVRLRKGVDANPFKEKKRAQTSRNFGGLLLIGGLLMP